MGIYANGMLCCILYVMWKKYVTENKYSQLAGTVISVLCIFLMNGVMHKYDGDVNLQAVEKVPADTVYILPNNGNIILAAEQARDLTEDKKVVVIPSTNIPQGIAAMINFMPGQPAEENTQQMTEEMGNVKSGQVTYAVRDTRMDGQEIKQGDYMGIADKKIVAVEKGLPEVTVELVEGMIDEESELVSLYYGADVTEKDAEAVADLILKDHDDLEVEVQYGGQPVYYYLVSVE